MASPHFAAFPPQDVRRYILDVLWAHADVQRFNVTPSAGARPLTHRTLLDQFVFDKDRGMILAAYPWLRCGLDGGSGTAVEAGGPAADASGPAAESTAAGVP